MEAFDCSNYSGVISLEQAYEAYGQGYRKAIVQVIDPPAYYPVSVWRQQIPTLLAVGFEVEAYVYLYLRDNPSGRVQWVLNQIGMLNNNVNRVWLDVEDTDDSSISLEARQYALWESVETVRRSGRTAGIYTAAWYWQQYFPGVTWLSYLPLWVAQYDGVKDLNVFNPFGGWSRAAMKQYVGTSGIWLPSQPMINQVDLNVY